MIIFENTEVVGWEHAIRGMRNPLNSWEKSDSEWNYDCFEYDFAEYRTKDEFEVGPNDLNLMKRLRNAGTDHRKFMRMLTVYVDITAPLYWWKEFDTYKVGTVANSCSTMHCIHKKEFTLDDFSHEHLMTIDDVGARDTDTDKDPRIYARYDHISEDGHVRDGSGCIIPDEFYPVNDAEYTFYPIDILKCTIRMLNRCRHCYLKTKDKKYWWQMIQLLPTSYNQKRTVMLNYEVLTNMYKSRKNHKLDEWLKFCDWIETLPYSKLITGIEKTPSVEELDAFLEKVKEVDERIARYVVYPEYGMRVLDFVDENSKILWIFNLNRVSLAEAFECIKKGIQEVSTSLLSLGA